MLACTPMSAPGLFLRSRTNSTSSPDPYTGAWTFAHAAGAKVLATRGPSSLVSCLRKFERDDRDRSPKEVGPLQTETEHVQRNEQQTETEVERLAGVLGPTIMALTASETLNYEIWDKQLPAVTYLKRPVPVRRRRFYPAEGTPVDPPLARPNHDPWLDCGARRARPTVRAKGAAAGRERGDVRVPDRWLRGRMLPDVQGVLASEPGLRTRQGWASAARATIDLTRGRPITVVEGTGCHEAVDSLGGLDTSILLHDVEIRLAFASRLIEHDRRPTR